MLFMHIADFYAMWLSDRKQLWSIGQNISLFKANLEGVRDRIGRKRRKTCAQELKTNDMGKIYTRKIPVRNRSHAAVHPCRHTDPAVLFQPHCAYDTDPIEVETGETVHYADSTRNARSWLWEFGNGTHITRMERRIRSRNRDATKYAFKWTED
ncbi:type VI secretion system transmembrane protein TssO [Phocaeicola dorei]|nr:type VI secretion system transmembrane protein TssO [Phocaeicola dorei]